LSLKIPIVLSVFAIFLLFGGTTLTSFAQSDLQTTKHRNMVIDLGNGLETNARLNLPITGEGPFPGVLLVPGSGPVDMNETGGYLRIDNKTGSLIYPDARPFYDIAQYLSDRGFAVLQYDKRAIGANITFLDSNVWGNVTVDDLIQDAQKALDELLKQPEVNSQKITLIGHSEGTTIIPRIAINNPDKVDNIVLMGTLAQSLLEIGKHQIMTPAHYAQEVLDTNHDGLISLQKASKDPVFNSLIGDLYPLLTQFNSVYRNETFDRNDSQYDINNDTLININNELKPILQNKLQSMSGVTKGERCDVLKGPCPIWVSSQYSLIPNLDIIGKVPTDVSILILQGENDTDTPLEQAFLLQQKLTELKHPDHTLITYPNLGHLFYPSSIWMTTLGGPIEPKVLGDLFEWLSNPLRGFKEFTILEQR
jgi:pimeloyl-ACP methyl ester carboxylesterase